MLVELPNPYSSQANMKLRMLLPLVVVAAGTVSACGDSLGPRAESHRLLTADGLRIAAAQGVSGGIAVTPNPLKLVVGQTAATAVTYLRGTAKSDLIDVPSRAYRVLDARVASVTAAGQVTAKQAGTTHLIVTQARLADTVPVTVTAPPSPVSVTPSVAEIVVGTSVSLAARGGVADGPLTWRTSDAAVATVSSAGIATGIKPGKATITVSDGRTSASAVITVVPSKSRSVSVPATIDATGKADVTVALNAFVASVRDSSTIVFPQGARYRVEGTLYFENRRALTLEGNGATVFAATDGSKAAPPTKSLAAYWPRTRIHVLFAGGENIVVRNLAVQGANPHAGTGDLAYRSSLEAQHGFQFSGVRGGELDRVTVTDVYGDFVYFGPSNGRPSSGIRVHDSHFERNGRQGMAFTGGEDIVIEGNFMSEVRRAHFDIEPNSADNIIRRVTIQKNRFGPGRLLFLAAHGNAGTVEDIAIVDNTLIGKSLNLSVSAPPRSRRARFRIVGNTADRVYGNPGGHLMFFQRVDGVEVRGNRNPVEAGRQMVGVRTRESCNVVVRDNVWPNGIGESTIETPTCDP
jgi:hypothetical protein